MITIATLGSHCALQVLKGAKDEAFRTLVVTQKSREKFYRRFKFIDDFLVLDKFADITKPKNIAFLKKRGSIMIPHGTLISEVGIEKVEDELDVPVFGNRHILRWESNRELKDKLTREARLRSPETFSSPDKIDRLVIAKLPGAKGGLGYFLANDEKSYWKNVKELQKKGIIDKKTPIFIQEYVVGVPVYFQYFYSPLKKELEFFGIDRRYETTVDGIGRIPAEHQKGLLPSYIVVGNIPLVLRESLLEEAYQMGERFVKAVERRIPPGMIGPFCIEGIYNDDAEFVTFEYSARIVAGTNLYIAGSPYFSLIYDEPMSMGRRIAREIKDAKKSLDKLLT
ncbi:MAG: formate--phosphoribosylaminoimidazolecarboxamide ligase [Thaumarchaeota archaeon]|nr:formate--phosphoribosylaminoimidazolecarboxamide ligase [Nitrososphaerota archaeon]